MSKETREKVQGVSVWWREDRSRWYADLRSYADQGGGREVLRDLEDVPLDFPPREGGEVPVAVQRAVSRRLDILEGRRKRSPKGNTDPTLLDYSTRWLGLREPNLAPNTYRSYETKVGIFIDFMGGSTRLSEVGVADLNDFIAWRRRQGCAPNTIRTDLNTIQNLFSWAQSERAVRENPVARLPDKPAPQTSERVWLEIGEAARYMEAAWRWREEPYNCGALPEIIATQLLTGGGLCEVTGLRQEEVDLEEGVVRFRHNHYRDLKTDHRERDVPLWPQLREILEEYEWPDHDLLFVSYRTGEQYSGNIGKRYPDVADMTKDLDKRITSHVLRHTYAAARLQTVDRGRPVSPYTVAQEMGHKDLRMIEDHYGHLMEVRHRSEAVEYVETDVQEIGRNWHQTGTNASGGS